MWRRPSRPPIIRPAAQPHTDRDKPGIRRPVLHCRTGSPGILPATRFDFGAEDHSGTAGQIRPMADNEQDVEGTAGVTWLQSKRRLLTVAFRSGFRCFSQLVSRQRTVMIETGASNICLPTVISIRAYVAYGNASTLFAGKSFGTRIRCSGRTSVRPSNGRVLRNCGLSELASRLIPLDRRSRLEFLRIPSRILYQSRLSGVPRFTHRPPIDRMPAGRVSVRKNTAASPWLMRTAAGSSVGSSVRLQGFSFV